MERELQSLDESYALWHANHVGARQDTNQRQRQQQQQQHWKRQQQWQRHQPLSNSLAVALSSLLFFMRRMLIEKIEAAWALRAVMEQERPMEYR